MTPENFCFWLQGFFDLNGIEKKKTPHTISNVQADLIRKQLISVTDNLPHVRDQASDESSTSTTFG